MLAALAAATAACSTAERAPSADVAVDVDEVCASLLLVATLDGDGDVFELTPFTGDVNISAGAHGELVAELSSLAQQSIPGNADALETAAKVSSMVLTYLSLAGDGPVNPAEASNFKARLESFGDVDAARDAVVAFRDDDCSDI